MIDDTSGNEDGLGPLETGGEHEKEAGILERMRCHILMPHDLIL